MIRRCDHRDFDLVWAIINDGAQAYKGIIPTDRWTEPYMSRAHLQHELDEGVIFWGYEKDGTLTGVMGIQPVQDVTLIRHAYVRTGSQKHGIGAHLLAHLLEMAKTPILIGTWPTRSGRFASTRDTAFKWSAMKRKSAFSGNIGPSPSDRSKHPLFSEMQSGGILAQSQKEVSDAVSGRSF
jgi:GNAT superfamily N-acetyltransferase